MLTGEAVITEVYGFELKAPNELVFAYANGDDNYALVIGDDKRLYENKGAEWYPEPIELDALIKKALMTEKETYAPYMMAGLFGLLKDLRMKTESVVERLVAQTKGMEQHEFAGWLAKCTDGELESLTDTFRTILGMVAKEVVNRNPDEYADWGEDGEDE